MRRIKAWALLLTGALIFALGFISAANFSFDWEFIMPSSIILAVLLIPAGGTLFAHGLLALDSPPTTSVGHAGPQAAATGIRDSRFLAQGRTARARRAVPLRLIGVRWRE